MNDKTLVTITEFERMGGVNRRTIERRIKRDNLRPEIGKRYRWKLLEDSVLNRSDPRGRKLVIGRKRPPATAKDKALLREITRSRKAWDAVQKPVSRPSKKSILRGSGSGFITIEAIDGDIRRWMKTVPPSTIPQWTDTQRRFLSNQIPALWAFFQEVLPHLPKPDYAGLSLTTSSTPPRPSA